MSVVFDILINSYGTEVDFMKAVINYVTGISTDITCLDDPDDEYDIETVTLSHIPSFRFCINNIHLFTIKRGYALSNTTPLFYIDMIDKNGDVITSTVIRSNADAHWSANANRRFWLSHILSNDFFLLNFHGSAFGGDVIPVTILAAKSENDLYSGYKVFGNVSYPSGYTQTEVFEISDILMNGYTNDLSGAFLSRFSYKAQPGKTDYIKNSIYINNGYKAFSIYCIYDCTEVNVLDTVSLKDGAYFAVGPHQLVKVS